jgi:hypothetical protein
VANIGKPLRKIRVEPEPKRAPRRETEPVRRREAPREPARAPGKRVES